MDSALPFNFLQKWNSEIELALEKSNALCLAIFNFGGELIFANPAFKVLLTDTPKESILNPTFDALLKLNGNKPLIFEGILTIGNMSHTDNISIQGKVFRKDKELLIIGEIDIKELISVNNKLVILNNEVFELHKNILKSKKEAETANNAKSEFLMNLSHEIRTPLNGVIGFTDLLMKSKLEETQSLYLDIVYRSANSLLELLNCILDFSKLESDKIELSIEKVDLYALLKEASELIKNELDAKKLKLIMKVYPNLPQYIFSDPIRLRQILINLIGNAIKFTEKGEIEIEVRLISENELRQEAQIFFSVRDTGIGVSKENQSRIFEAFSQADSSINRKYGGTGLGLPIANKLLALMSSKLEIKSEYGIGSIFYFTINVKLEKHTMTQEEKPFLDLLKPKDSKLTFAEGLKILIVDDDEINLFLTKSILNKVLPKGIIFEATNAESAIEQFQTEKPNIIFMDVQMPEMSGHDATIAIRKLETNSRIPIIALTAGARDEEINKCLQCGMDDYISKPAVADTIEITLAKWLNDN